MTHRSTRSLASNTTFCTVTPASARIVSIELGSALRSVGARDGVKLSAALISAAPKRRVAGPHPPRTTTPLGLSGASLAGTSTPLDCAIVAPMRSGLSMA